MTPRVDSLPDDLWLKIFDTGITGSNFSCDDLSSLSISCKHFDALSKQDALWSFLLTTEFPGSPPPPPPRGGGHSSSSSSSMKSVYKDRLGKELHGRRASIVEEAVGCEHQLNLLSWQIGMIRYGLTELKNPVRKFAARILLLGNNSPLEYHQQLKAIYHRLILIDDLVKNLAGALLHMIIFREHGAQPPVIECQASSAFPAPRSHSPPQLDADITFLEKRADYLVTEHQKFINYFLVDKCKIQILLNQQKDCDKQLVGIIERMVFFNTCNREAVNVLEDGDTTDEASGE